MRWEHACSRTCEPCMHAFPQAILARTLCASLHCQPRLRAPWCERAHSRSPQHGARMRAHTHHSHAHTRTRSLNPHAHTPRTRAVLLLHLRHQARHPQALVPGGRCVRVLAQQWCCTTGGQARPSSWCLGACACTQNLNWCTATGALRAEGPHPATLQRACLQMAGALLGLALSCFRLDGGLGGLQRSARANTHVRTHSPHLSRTSWQASPSRSSRTALWTACVMT